MGFLFSAPPICPICPICLTSPILGAPISYLLSPNFFQHHPSESAHHKKRVALWATRNLLKGRSATTLPLELRDGAP